MGGRDEASWQSIDSYLRYLCRAASTEMGGGGGGQSPFASGTSDACATADGYGDGKGKGLWFCCSDRLMDSGAEETMADPHVGDSS